ncbi:pentapeptide repeat-containing protein [Nocardia sp. NPDC056000]|uniref:pentapeptide repeat-containing protein n=1 Tax=Nocardia sp. NPDC056000 TaxID=3345674 RepID=UPI0035DF1EEA
MSMPTPQGRLGRLIDAWKTPLPPPPPAPEPEQEPEPSRLNRLGRDIGKAATWDGWLKLGAIVTAVGVLAGLYFTNNSLKATTVQNEATRRVALTDQFNKAVAALDSGGLNARIGGIYSLEQLSIDSPQMRSAIFSVLAAFIKINAHTKDSKSCDNHTDNQISEDVAAALVIFTRNQFGDTPIARIDSVCLPGANLRGADLRNIEFINSNLNRTDFSGGQIGVTTFIDATMVNSFLTHVNLTGVWFQNSDLTIADFTDSNLTDARFIGGNLRGADFRGTDLTGTCFGNVDISEAFFVEESRSDLAKNINKARFVGNAHAGTRWPTGFSPPTTIDRPHKDTDDISVLCG